VAAVAAGTAGPYMADVHVGGSHLRELAFQIPGAFDGQPIAVVLARPLNGVDNVLRKLRLLLAVVVVGAIGLAVVLGRLAAGRVLAPLAEVADTARHIGETEDLTARIRVRADDEVGQLARRFNAMLERLQASRAALDESVRAQRQLVADASHELRTPITSLRTNIELLLAHEQLPEAERRRMLADVVEQTEDLSALVSDLIELARGEEPGEPVEGVRLDSVTAEALERARRNFPQIEFLARLQPALLEADPDRIGRAVGNLLDNAARHSPPHGQVEVAVDEHGVRVRDHGAGVAEEDLPHIFDRFYRGATARGRQGSGLGLAIVRQVAEQHHGTVTVTNAPDGGAVFTLRLPASPANPERDGPSERGARGDGSAPAPPEGESRAGRPDHAGLARDPEALAQ
jgi:two-component system sensor histidine kinase MprB